MSAINFSEQFADAVERGTKRQTIRRPRKRPIRVGERLYLWSGMRTKKARKLREVACTWITPITIEEHSTTLSYQRLGDPAEDAFAQMDGFENAAEMRSWFRSRYGLPFSGVVIYW